MKKLIPVISLMLVTLGLCLFFILRKASEEQGAQTIEVHCAAALRHPVEEIARLYETEHGIKVMLNYGGSGQLYGALKIRGGDLYIPADDSYITTGVTQGIITESIPLCQLTAGIVVLKGNPKHIKTLADLTRHDISLAIAEKTAAVGAFTHQILHQAHLLDAIEQGIGEGIGEGRLRKFPTVTEVATQVQLSAADAGIIWDALMPQYQDHLLFIHTPELDANPKQAAAGLITSSHHPTTALHFAHYLATQIEITAPTP